MMALIHQPEYLPWMGFFDKMERCDKFVVYDSVQFERSGFQNRNRIRTSGGWKWLTVPIVHNHTQAISDVRISGTKWKKDHIKSIYFSYSNTEYFDDYFPMIRDAINSDSALLVDLDMRLIEAIADSLDIRKDIIRSSELGCESPEKNERLAEICKSTGADSYLSGQGAAGYSNPNTFSDAGVRLMWHRYSHPEYYQKFGSFEPFMSVIDVMFNNGPRSKEIIMKGGAIDENTGDRGSP
jgi:hypothetical protein